jgi:hypothetical protein
MAMSNRLLLSAAWWRKLSIAISKWMIADGRRSEPGTGVEFETTQSKVSGDR